MIATDTQGDLNNWKFEDAKN